MTTVLRELITQRSMELEFQKFNVTWKNLEFALIVPIWIIQKSPKGNANFAVHKIYTKIFTGNSTGRYIATNTYEGRVGVNQRRPYPQANKSRLRYIVRHSSGFIS